MSRVVLDLLQERFPDAVLETHAFRGDETAVVDAARLIEVAHFIKEEPDLTFDLLTDATAVDYLLDPLREIFPRFEVVYHFYSVGRGKRLRLKVRVSEEALEVDSLSELWPIANWLEREIWDMYGIRFHGHPNLRRLLLYEEFVGHPLRKDYAKEKRQPLARRPVTEMVEVLDRSRPAIWLTVESPTSSEVESSTMPVDLRSFAPGGEAGESRVDEAGKSRVDEAG